MDEVIWIVDTSSVIEVRRTQNTQRAQVFNGMSALVENGRLFFPKQVLRELERAADAKSPDAQYQWAKENSPKACSRSPTLEDVQKVLAVVPTVLDPDKDTGADEADPYVLAVAVRLRAEKKDARIVTEENREMLKKMSLRTAAGMLGVASVPLKAFLEFEKIV